MVSPEMSVVAASVQDMEPAIETPVIVRRDGAITRITLNRPRAINALNSETLDLLRAAILTANADGSSAIVLAGAGERGLCGGGDIKEIRATDQAAYFSLEYGVDYLIHTSAVPVVAFMDGIVMGGGIGISGHAAHRVVTERSRLAMPEVRIGIVPDVGGHLLLANAPDRLGEYLAVTAGEFGAADAIALGFADACVPSDRLESLARELAGGTEPAAAIAQLSVDPGARPLADIAEWWCPLVEDVLVAHDPLVDPVLAAQALIAALDANPHGAARETADAMRGMCPTSLAITLAQIARTRAESLDLAAVLRDDFRVLTRIGSRYDFIEGVRAQVIHKDRNPAWQPSSLDELDADEVRSHLAPATATEVELELAPCSTR